MGGFTSREMGSSAQVKRVREVSTLAQRPS